MISPFLQEMTARAKAVVPSLINAPLQQKNQALSEISRALLGHAGELTAAMLQELPLNEPASLEFIVRDLLHIMDLPDLVGDVFDSVELPNGLKLTKYRTPLGILGLVIDEDPLHILVASALAIKSDNPLIVWSAQSIGQTSRLLTKIIQAGLEAADLPIDTVQLVSKNDENALREFVSYKSGLEAILLKGSSKLVKFCDENSLVPLLYEKPGVCHLYVDQMINIDKSLEVILNAKTQNPAANNSITTLLVHEAIAEKLLPLVFKNLQQEDVSFHLDSKCWNIFVNLFLDAGETQLAEPEDWDIAWHSNVLNIKVVNNIEDALEHIRLHGIGYCEGILTEHPVQAMIFASTVNASAIMINASTRFLDGAQMGLGPQMLINNQKSHAVGPIGIKELMSYKWLIQGNYHLRD